MYVSHGVMCCCYRFCCWKQQVATAQPAARTGSLTKKGDWIEATDPGSGRQYWHNAVTGESTWVDPHAV